MEPPYRRQPTTALPLYENYLDFTEAKEWINSSPSQEKYGPLRGTKNNSELR